MAELNAWKNFLAYCRRECLVDGDHVKKQYALMSMPVFTEQLTVERFFKDQNESQWFEADFIGIYEDTNEIKEKIKELDFKILDFHTNPLMEGYALTESNEYIRNNYSSDLQLFKWVIYTEGLAK